MIRRARSVLAVTASLGLTGCGGGPPVPVGWVDDDAPIARQNVEAYAGEDHCDWASAVFLHVAWPPDGSAWYQFVRDPEAVVSDDLAGRLDLDAELPEDAVSTGYRSNKGIELWLAADADPEAAYLVDSDGAVESWPRAEPVIGCD